MKLTIPVALATALILGSMAHAADDAAEASDAASISQRHLAAWQLAFAATIDRHQVEAAVSSDDAVMRYWGAMAILRTPRDSAERAEMLPLVQPLLADASPAVQVVAAEIVALSPDSKVGITRLETLSQHPQEAVRVQVLAAIERLAAHAEVLRPVLTEAQNDSSEYVKRIASRTLAKLNQQP
ncbi:hypothetical protein Psta_2451 [Pirellula staleyi DSM 6068]|uniref:HEAT repeat domain-containing protein n=1 Tax=Pirellula staleyi (strain ATCC 27377 / DSM 6068 / ICPB 4128) TaxID=530564 RepID=D2R4Q4_PIRSD|nr:hypothetical protein [Pirellula staleyi]ADB17120.1 hypothetical protein Psta_2451 [Pirellula staleyi DSM 6068]